MIAITERIPSRMKSIKHSVYELRPDSSPTTGQRLACIAPALALLLAVCVSSGCDVERRKSDAELGLNPQQSSGRKIYDNYCDRCHRSYSTKGKKGPGLKGIFQHQFLSLSGLPANDERVTDIIRNGRPDMPGYSQTLSPQDIKDLLAYLHTL
jgi:mono/diheme cytochrome c family protein